MIETDKNYFSELEQTVSNAIKEDLGTGDVTVELIDHTMKAKAQVISRDDATVCGIPWVNEVFFQIDPSLTILWQVKDGDQIEANQLLLTIDGCARSILPSNIICNRDSNALLQPTHFAHRGTTSRYQKDNSGPTTCTEICRIMWWRLQSQNGPI